jgi:hypothetical protein
MHITASTSHQLANLEDDDSDHETIIEGVPWEFEREPPVWLNKLRQQQERLSQAHTANFFHPDLTR